MSKSNYETIVLTGISSKIIFILALIGGERVISYSRDLIKQLIKKYQESKKED